MSPNSATDCTRPRVRSVICCAPASTRPPGISAFCAWSARDTSVTVRFCACSRAGIQRDVDLALPAADDHDLADAADALELAAQRLVGVFGDVANRLVGRDRERHDRRGVGIELLDRRLLDRARQRRQDAVDAVAHFLRRDVAVLLEQERDDDVETPSEEVDLSSSMPLMVLTASSILSEISVSISSGAAPGSLVVTTTVGKSTFGKRSRPRRENEKAPMTVSARMRTLAKTGRLTEIAANHCMMTSTFALHADAVGQLPARIGGDLLAGLDAGGQLDAVADFFAERHDALFDLVVLATT